MVRSGKNEGVTVALMKMVVMAPVFELIINRVPYYITLIIIGGGYLPLPGYFRQAICFFMLGLLMGTTEAKNPMCRTRSRRR